MVSLTWLVHSTLSARGKTASKITAVKPSESKDKRLIQKIQHELNLIGISPKVIGYRYLTDAILATINEPLGQEGGSSMTVTEY